MLDGSNLNLYVDSIKSTISLVEVPFEYNFIDSNNIFSISLIPNSDNLCWIKTSEISLPINFLFS